MFLHTAEAFRTAEPVRRATTIGLDRTRLPLAGRIALPKRPALGAIDAAALVETEQGWKRIADLTPGMAIHTRDGGLQRLVRSEVERAIRAEVEQSSATI